MEVVEWIYFSADRERYADDVKRFVLGRNGLHSAYMINFYSCSELEAVFVMAEQLIHSENIDDEI